MIIMALFAFFATLFGFASLILFHELGHYVVARCFGMTVEIFSIGMGGVVWASERWGTRWQICALPIGGYVKIAGFSSEDADRPDGFYRASWFARVCVVLAGPIMNLLLALFFFTVLAFGGGRLQFFSHATPYFAERMEQAVPDISARNLFKMERYGTTPIKHWNDHRRWALFNADTQVSITGQKMLLPTGAWKDFSIETTGELLSQKLVPTQYIIVDKPPESAQHLHQQRLVWAQGFYLTSFSMLQKLIQQVPALLTIERNGVQHVVVEPRLPVVPTSFSSRSIAKIHAFIAQYATPPQQLLSLQWTLNTTGVVEERIATTAPTNLQPGDTICAVDGIQTPTRASIIHAILHPHIVCVSSKGPVASTTPFQDFLQGFRSENLMKVLESGTAHGDYTHTRLPISATESGYRLGIQVHDHQQRFASCPMADLKHAWLDAWSGLQALFAQQVSMQQFSGPVGMARMLYQAQLYDPLEGLFWLGTVSVVLAFYNLLPIPGLDGGYLTFFMIEGVTQRRIPLVWIERLTVPFIIALLTLGGLIAYWDSVKLLFG